MIVTIYGLAWLSMKIDQYEDRLKYLELNQEFFLTRLVSIDMALDLLAESKEDKEGRG